MKQTSSISLITQTSLFIALTVLLSYVFAIHTTFIHITFGFLSTAIFAVMHGPLRAGIMAAIACFIGMLLFGQGVFFPGFMLSEFLVGYTFGHFLYKKPITLKRVAIPFLIITIVIHLGLNTLWLVIFYQKAASAIFMGRLIKNIICYPIEIVLFFAVYKTLGRIIPALNPSKLTTTPKEATPNT
ncbi:folate family ECF transporter S component [Veillonella intestinalis]|uniref:folate family ECF transporter S component n=1 Tax=Veillonella intestinalis TaxID=2941341 RepID=UPI0020418FA5|nr:folate family ECF transporter S component [Veillonella intestinalis]